MSSINTNIPSLLAQQNLATSQSSLQTSLERLSTGLKINTGADDPAGLIASQGFQAEISGINQAIGNSTQATNVISIADGALSQIENLLQSIQSLVVQSANSGALSPTQLSANQTEVDSAIQSITQIANSTSFDGLPLLDGSLSFLTSGVQSSDIAGLVITQANFGTSNVIPVTVSAITSARTAALEFRTSAIASPLTLIVNGNEGSQSVALSSGATAAQILAAVNQLTGSTGVSATFINAANPASGVSFNSLGYGSSQFVSVQAQSGTFVTTNTSGNDAARAQGQDVVADINGVQAVGSGLDLSVNTEDLNLNVNLTPTFGLNKTSFTITGGGARFQLGSQVSANEQITLGIQSVAANDLGNSTVGFLNQVAQNGSASLTTNTTQASSILTAVIQQVALLRGQLGAFQANTLETNINSLNIALENVSSSQSTIADTNFATETSNFTRDQILVQAATSVLATANATPQNILKLLG